LAGHELTFDQKMVVLDHLRGHSLRLDISGGDPLSASEGISVLREVATRIGRENVTLTATGSGMSRYDVADIAPFIGELNFTYDGIPDSRNPLRPPSYARSNLRKALQFATAGVTTRAECPLSPQNLDPPTLERIYRELAEAGVAIMLVMRLFPVGRGANIRSQIPTAQAYREAVGILRQLERDYPGGPRIKLQCAL